MDWRMVQNWVYAYGLSLCCIIAPLLLGLAALDRTASMLTHRAAGLELRYEFLSTIDLPRAASVAEVKQIAGKNEQDLAVTFLAKDLRGRALYAIASALLYLASAAAIGFGLGVVGRPTERGSHSGFCSAPSSSDISPPRTWRLQTYCGRW